MSSNKKAKGQFYTVRSNYILDGFDEFLTEGGITKIVEPFAGQGDLLDWIRTQFDKALAQFDGAKAKFDGSEQPLPVISYDLDPKRPDIVQRDTLLDPPDYTGAFVLTNPPFLARNKAADKTVFDRYGTNDLYKCFLASLTGRSKPEAGILILPVGFFLSVRPLDELCRHSFLSTFRVVSVRCFEEAVFPDTSTSVVALAFTRSDEPLSEQEIPWTFLPSGDKRTFRIQAATGWMVGGEIYKMPDPLHVQVRRHVVDLPLAEGEQQLNLTLTALDSGSHEGTRISLSYKEGYVYPGIHCARTFATLRVRGLDRILTGEEQVALAAKFNAWLEAKRAETRSLFLPQYRESKEYARKRMPFELAYKVVANMLAGTL
jgi:hypothetical protein